VIRVRLPTSFAQPLAFPLGPTASAAFRNAVKYEGDTSTCNDLPPRGWIGLARPYPLALSDKFGTLQKPSRVPSTHRQTGGIARNHRPASTCAGWPGCRGRRSRATLGSSGRVRSPEGPSGRRCTTRCRQRTGLGIEITFTLDFMPCGGVAVIERVIAIQTFPLGLERCIHRSPSPTGDRVLVHRNDGTPSFAGRDADCSAKQISSADIKEEGHV
jgi:hypothetical protein